MMGALSRMVDSLFGWGEAAVTLPPLDGAFRPNCALDEATSRHPLPDVDCLVLQEGQLIAAAEDTLFELDAAGRWRERRIYDRRIACIAPVDQNGLAIAFEDGEVAFEGGERDGRTYRIDAKSCITAITVSGSRLFVAFGSETHPLQAWQADLMERNASGSLWRVDLDSGESRCLASELAWPSGLAVSGSSVVVSEAWKHRILCVPIDGGIQPRALCSDLPGYPGRLWQSGDDYWLAIFAPRRQIVEFVLREPAYRRRMMAEVPRAFWIAPTLRSGRSYYEPVLGGSVKQLGQLKPWAPTMSFGLCVRLDKDFQPQESFHSRADGSTHGITSVVERDGLAFAASRGDGVVVSLSCAANGIVSHADR